MKLRQNFPINKSLREAEIVELCEILLERLRDDKVMRPKDGVPNGPLRIALVTYMESHNGPWGK